MSAIDHAAAHERIEDLLLEPARLAALRSSAAPEDVALREHLDGCPVCRADLDGWARLQSALGEAFPGSDATAAAAVEPVELPPSLRARVLTAVRADHAADHTAVTPVAIDPAGTAPGTTASAHPSRLGPLTQPRAAWLGLAAALVVLVVGAGLVVEQTARLATAQTEAAALTEAMAAVDRILEAPHKVVPLQQSDGATAGSISWSRHDWVVLTSALTQPPTGHLYKCWLERDGRSVPVGVMEFAGATAYWVASVDEFATWEMGPGARFVVTLESAATQQRTGPAVLEAALGS
jgi:hypothetical protein